MSCISILLSSSSDLSSTYFYLCSLSDSNLFKVIWVLSMIYSLELWSLSTESLYKSSLTSAIEASLLVPFGLEIDYDRIFYPEALLTLTEWTLDLLIYLGLSINVFDLDFSLFSLLLLGLTLKERFWLLRSVKSNDLNGEMSLLLEWLLPKLFARSIIDDVNTF